MAKERKFQRAKDEIKDPYSSNQARERFLQGQCKSVCFVFFKDRRLIKVPDLIFRLQRLTRINDGFFSDTGEGFL